jgi:hypothetical protein
MRDDELDYLLSKDQEMIPSSGFVTSVMDAVRREATTPPPIPFPWKYALPGIVAYGVVLVAIVVTVYTQPSRVTATSAPPVTLQSLLTPIVETAKIGGIGWMCFALLLTLFSVMYSRRLTRISG